MRLALPPSGQWGRRYGHWMNEALAAEPDARVHPLEGERLVDVAIVGGGYVGLWTAIRITEAEPDARVCVLEADICGSGASGRNGGFAFGWWAKLEALIERVGEREALRLATAAEEAVGELQRFCEAESVEADFRRAGWLWTATSEPQRGSWRGAIAACARLGAEPFEELDRAQVRRRTGSPAHLGGALEAGAATVQPALLARGLARIARRRGAEVYERTPVLAVDRGAGVLTTPAGSVRARSIVLATNCWLASIRELRRAIIPLGSDIVATAPMPAELERSGWIGGEAVSDSRLSVHYYRTSADGRVVFGKAGGRLARRGRFPDGFDLDPAGIRRTAGFMHRLVPASRQVPIADGWGGAVDRSRDGLPFFGALAGAVPIHYGAGFSGNGVVPSLLAGRILCSLALARRDCWSDCGLAHGVPDRFPPEPLRFCGGVLVRGAVRRMESREDRGLPTGSLTRRLAALAPSGFFKAANPE